MAHAAKRTQIVHASIWVLCAAHHDLFTYVVAFFGGGLLLQCGLPIQGCWRLQIGLCKGKLQPHLEHAASIFWLQATDPEQGLVPSGAGMRLLVTAAQVSEHCFTVGLLCRPSSIPGPGGILWD